MKVCVDCFLDIELKSFIESRNELLDCDCCDSKNVYSIDMDELTVFFQNLVGSFKISSSGTPLVDLIAKEWSFFANHEIGDKILNEVLPNLNTQILDSQARVDFSDEIYENVNYWDQFKVALIKENRYISDINYLIDPLGWDSFFFTQYEVGNESFYRARIHSSGDQSIFPCDKMGAPPTQNATAGRANPAGIPFLYLSDNKETVMYETRAAYLDDVSVGVFKKKVEEVVKIVDFTKRVPLYSPDNIGTIIKAHLLKRKISEDLSRPMRRYDSELDYIPTQFICEFIKVVTGADGIKFKSSVHAKGKNIVVFNHVKFDCIEVELHNVTKVVIESTVVTN